MIRIISIYICCIFSHLGASAIIEGMEMSLLNISKIELKPGNTSNIVIQLTNNTEADREFLLKITNPQGWNQLMNYNTVLVKKLSSANKILSFHIPEATHVGNYSIIIEAFEKSENLLIGNITLPVIIYPRYEILLKKLEAPDNVFSGEVFEIKYLVQNLSNVETSIKIKVVNGKKTEIMSYTLAPDSFIISSTSVSTQKDIQSRIRRNVLITASANESQEAETLLAHLYDILPSNQMKFDPYERFPIKVAGILATNNQTKNGSFATMFDITGSGWISEKNKRELSFQLRGPNQRGEPILGTNDSYFIRYSTENNKIIAGDYNYRLTDLTESSRYGRGGRYEHKINKFNIGTFINFPRFYPNLKQVTAIYASISPDNVNKFSAGYMLKSPNNKDAAHLITLSGSAKPFSWGSIESEYATGFVNSKPSNAYHANMKVNYKIIRSNFNYTMADKDFPGYLSNTKNLASGLNLNIIKSINLSIQYISNYSNFALDTMYSNAPFTRNLNLTISYKIHQNHSVNICAIKRTSEDRMENQLFDYEDNTIRMGINSNFNNVHINISGETGKMKNLLKMSEGELTNSFRANFALKYKMNEKTSFDAFINYMGNQRYLINEQKEFYYGGSINSQLSKLCLTAKYQSNYQIEEYYRDRSLLDLSCMYNPNNKHEFSVITEYNLTKNSLNKKELKILLKYTYTINVPLSKKENVGSLKGSIINNGVDNVEGVVLSYSGNIAVTDKEGTYNFPMIQSGESFLFIDGSKTGLHSIAERPGPYRINILPGQENHFNISFTRSARITGRLLIEDDENKDNKDYIPVKEELENLVIEAKNGEEMFRVITGKNGEFYFEDLRPGAWIVKIYNNGIPKGYELISDIFNVNLNSGQEVALSVKIKKIARKIKFQEPIQQKKK